MRGSKREIGILDSMLGKRQERERNGMVHVRGRTREQVVESKVVVFEDQGVCEVRGRVSEKTREKLSVREWKHREEVKPSTLNRHWARRKKIKLHFSTLLLTLISFNITNCVVFKFDPVSFLTDESIVQPISAREARGHDYLYGLITKHHKKFVTQLVRIRTNCTR